VAEAEGCAGGKVWKLGARHKGVRHFGAYQEMLDKLMRQVPRP